MTDQKGKLQKTIALAQELEEAEANDFFGWMVSEMVDIDPAKLTPDAQKAVIKLAAAVKSKLPPDET